VVKQKYFDTYIVQSEGLRGVAGFNYVLVCENHVPNYILVCVNHVHIPNYVLVCGTFLLSFEIKMRKNKKNLMLKKSLAMTFGGRGWGSALPNMVQTKYVLQTLYPAPFGRRFGDTVLTTDI
jgi:hypothetical protein